VATAETILRLVQSIPSPRAEPIKLWLAKVGQERLQELSNPELAVDRAVDTWKRQGRPKKWIEQRMRGQETRKNLTDHWQTHEVEQGRDFARLTMKFIRNGPMSRSGTTSRSRTSNPLKSKGSHDARRVGVH